MRISGVLLAASVIFAAEFWNEKKASDWTKEEKERVLTQSPWAKRAGAGLDETKGAARTNRRVLYGGMEPARPGTMPHMTALIRWESAEPVRAAAGGPLPEEAKGYVVIGVSMTGVIAPPRLDGNEELMRTTSFSAKGKGFLNPVRVIRQEQSGSLLFLFEKKWFGTAGGSDWLFETDLGGMDLKAKFSDREMRYLGKPAL